jgi:Sugar-transfer associated ATP-grasp
MMIYCATDDTIERSDWGRRLMMAQRGIARSSASRLGRWWGFFRTHSRVGLPWFWPARPPGQHAMVEARRMVRRHFGRDHHPVLRKLAQVLVAMAWPSAVLISLWEVWHWLGSREVASRVPGALWVAIRHNIWPVDYYGYGLWRSDRRVNIDNFLYSHEAPRLFQVLNRPSHPDPIDDKLAFYEMCKAHALPTPAVLAAFAPTGKLVDFESGRPPQHDLFVKACTGSGLAERFRWRGGDFESNRGCRLRAEDLGGYLANRARNENRALLVQPVLSNHPDLRVDSNDALATARLVTGRSIHGEVTPIFSFILFGLANKITAHSNCVTLIDVANGGLMPAPPQDQASPGMAWYQYREFGSNACTVPDWDAALRHVNMAHNACFNFVFVGWDLAFTPYGPMILEGNASWDAVTYQTLRGEPLAHTKFTDILTAQLNLPK